VSSQSTSKTRAAAGAMRCPPPLAAPSRRCPAARQATEPAAVKGVGRWVQQAARRWLPPRLARRRRLPWPMGCSPPPGQMAFRARRQRPPTPGCLHILHGTLAMTPPGRNATGQAAAASSSVTSPAGRRRRRRRRRCRRRPCSAAAAAASQRRPRLRPCAKDREPGHSARVQRASMSDRKGNKL
jgi:hypothetical protein